MWLTGRCGLDHYLPYHEDQVQSAVVCWRQESGPGEITEKVSRMIYMSQRRVHLASQHSSFSLRFSSGIRLLPMPINFITITNTRCRIKSILLTLPVASEDRTMVGCRKPSMWTEVNSFWLLWHHGLGLDKKNHLGGFEAHFFITTTDMFELRKVLTGYITIYNFWWYLNGIGNDQSHWVLLVQSSQTAGVLHNTFEQGTEHLHHSARHGDGDSFIGSDNNQSALVLLWNPLCHLDTHLWVLLT